jgi:hypothetical protein
MRDKPHEKIENGRILNGRYGSKNGESCGAFILLGPCGRELTIIVSDGVDPDAGGWEHVSVSIKGKNPPNWEEM